MNNIIFSLIGLAGAVFLLVFLTVRWKVPVFLALLAASYLAGISSGSTPDVLVTQITQGFGNTLGDIGLVIVLGTLLGAILEGTGATTAIAWGILRLFRERFPGAALAAIGYVVSIPIYCDSGFVILNSVREHLSRIHRVSPVFLSTVLGCALYATHTLVPPTPGPLAAMTNLQLSGELPRILGLGLFFSLVALVAGFMWAKFYAARYLTAVQTKNTLSPADKPERNDVVTGCFLLSALPVLIPIVLISSVGWVDDDSVLKYLGHPVNALLIGLLCCWPLIRRSGLKGQLSPLLTKGLESGGKIILVVGCGGAFGYVLRDSGMALWLVNQPGVLQWGLFLPFLTAAFIKTAEGSATVALITASVLIDPLLPVLGLDSVNGRLLALFACGGGAMTVAHVNDSFFWVIAEFTGLDTATALKALTVATLIQGVAVLAGVQIVSMMIL
ncbi:Inner membrane permease YgbN [invertebrate metagenome]|uniref:Inner membrane permease YgbN n=1 Tax=invertebrate metagenome TaxID=1711999 RepID=A0A2H9T4S8_9ZZZZ